MRKLTGFKDAEANSIRIGDIVRSLENHYAFEILERDAIFMLERFMHEKVSPEEYRRFPFCGFQIANLYDVASEVVVIGSIDDEEFLTSVRPPELCEV